MNTLDSRFLKTGNCYVATFPVAGDFRYVLNTGSASSTKVDDDEGFSIKVEAKQEANSPAKHFTLEVKREGQQLTPDIKMLELEVGDMVLWHTSDPSIFGFSVFGSGQTFSFNSQRLRAEAVYSHAFGLAGVYEWVDPVNREVSGVVSVKAMTPKTDREQEAWLEAASQGVTCEIRNGEAMPKKLDIVVGQTVFWKVWDGEGAAIVDKSLIAARPGNQQR